MWVLPLFMKCLFKGQTETDFLRHSYLDKSNNYIKKIKEI